MQGQSDSVFYFTLIDFLLQLLFFGIFLVTVSLSSSGERKGPSWLYNPLYWPNMEALGPFIREQNASLLRELTKLVKTPEELVTLVEALRKASSRGEGEVEKGLKIIADIPAQDIERAIGGLGKKSCFPDGSKPPLFDLEAFDDFVLVSSVSPEGLEVSRLLKFDAKEGIRIPRDKIASYYQPFLQKDCTYIVKVTMRTDSNRVRQAIESNFLILFARN